MKKYYLVLVLVALSVFALPAISKTGEENDDPMRNVLDHYNAERLLLVAFNDNSISSIVKGSASPTSYRNRGGAYQSSTWSARITDALADDYSMKKLAEWPMTEVGAHCVVYQIEDKSAMATTLDRLSHDKRVEIVQSMNVFKTKAHAQATSKDPYFKLQTNLQNMQIEMAHGKATGRDITVGIIDTGVALDHPDLTGQVSTDQNLVKDISSSFATDKHGTAVAGVIAARKDNAQGIIGVAPDAKLVALKACWPDKSDAMEAVCNSYSLALAVNTAIKMGVDVLNMSLTGPNDPILQLLLNQAIKKGIIVVAADTGSGDAKESFPASLKGVVSVQSTQPATSKSSANTSIIAPGEKVLTTLPFGTYDFISGSSIAAAEISGVVALLLELKHDLTEAQVRSILQKSRMKQNNDIATGINANLAVNSLCESNACSPKQISYVNLNPF